MFRPSGLLFFVPTVLLSILSERLPFLPMSYHFPLATRFVAMLLHESLATIPVISLASACKSIVESISTIRGLIRKCASAIGFYWLRHVWFVSSRRGGEFFTLPLHII